MGRRHEHPPRVLGPRYTSAHSFLGCTHKGSSNSLVRVCRPTRPAPRAVLGDVSSTRHCALCVFIYEARGRRVQLDVWISRVAGLPVYRSGTQSV